MIKLGINGVIRDVSQAKVGIGGVVRNVTGGYGGVGGAVCQFFGTLTGLTRFEIRIADIQSRPLSNSTSTILDPPTSYGYMQYGSTGSITYVALYEDGTMMVGSYNGMVMYLRANLYAVFSDGHSFQVNQLFRNTNASIVLTGSNEVATVGTGGTKTFRVSVLGNNYDTNSTSWSVSSMSGSNPYGFYIYVTNDGYDVVQVIVKNLAITVNGVSYPIKLVL